MRRKLGVVLFLLALVFFLAQAAGAQEQELVPFRETSGVLDGQIRLVKPASGLFIVEKNSIPYCFQLTSATQIWFGNAGMTSDRLAARKGESVRVEYRATRKGNIAGRILVR